MNSSNMNKFKTEKRKLKILLTRFGVFEIATSEINILTFSLNLHEITTDIFGDYTGDFKMIEEIIVREPKQTAAMRLKSIEHCESYINDIDMDYAADDIILTG